MFMLANTWPIVGIDVAGNSSSTSLLGTVAALYQEGGTGIAAVVVLTAFVLPGTHLILMIYAHSALTVRHRLPGLPDALRMLAALRPWAMVEVFMLGVLVSLAKLAALSRVIPGAGLWSLFAVIVLSAAAQAAFDTSAYWERLEQLE